MLFDGLDPFLTWRHLFQAARDQITGQQGATVDVSWTVPRRLPARLDLNLALLYRLST